MQEILARRAASGEALSVRVYDVAAVDLPEANDLTVGIMALVAQQEREATSRRTKEALSVARGRGVKLGNPNGAEALRRAGKGAQGDGRLQRRPARVGPRGCGGGHPR